MALKSDISVIHRRGRIVSAVLIGLLCLLTVALTAALFLQIGLIRMPASLQSLFEPTSAADNYAIPLSSQQQMIYNALPAAGTAAGGTTLDIAGVRITAANALELLKPLAAAQPDNLTRSDSTVYYISGLRYEIDSETVCSGSGWTVTQYRNGQAVYKYASDGKQTVITDLSDATACTVPAAGGPDGLATVSQLSYLLARTDVTVNNALLSQSENGNTLEVQFKYNGTSRAETWDIDLDRAIVIRVVVTDGGVTVMTSKNTSYTTH